MDKVARLVYKDLDGEKRQLELGKEEFRIGRLEENDLALDNPYISRYHAEITFDGSSYLVRDLGSTSGTFVNGERIEQQVINDGDRIRLGRGRGVELIFQEGGADQYSGEEAQQGKLHQVRIITPEEARFVNTAMLPDTADLANETIGWLRALYEFTKELLTAQSTADLSNRLAEFMHRTLKAERCAVLLYDYERESLEVVSRCLSTGALEVSPSRSITERVFRENVAVLSLDARHDKRFSDEDSVRFQSIRSVMGAPIGLKNRVWGVCYVDNLTTERAFNDEELEFLTAVARQAGLVIENLYLLEEQRHSLESFIRTLAASIDARDDNTAGHSARVGAHSAGIARVMGLSPAECKLIYYAGLLHDYGKIGTRDDVLLKPSELTPEEYEHVKEHPLHTFRILSKIRFPEGLAEIPLVAASHHERWNGAGYPRGLKGEEIPLGSRIVAVADAYDALAEDRVYSEAVEPERALYEIDMRSGTYFDPKVVEAFKQYFDLEIAPRHKRRQK